MPYHTPYSLLVWSGYRFVYNYPAPLANPPWRTRAGYLHNTASINWRLSRPLVPTSPALAGNKGFSFFQSALFNNLRGSWISATQINLHCMSEPSSLWLLTSSSTASMLKNFKRKLQIIAKRVFFIFMVRHKHEDTPKCTQSQAHACHRCIYYHDKDDDRHQ